MYEVVATIPRSVRIGEEKNSIFTMRMDYCNMLDLDFLTE
jgi:hypothetical protein